MPLKDGISSLSQNLYVTYSHPSPCQFGADSGVSVAIRINLLRQSLSSSRLKQTYPRVCGGSRNQVLMWPSQEEDMLSLEQALQMALQLVICPDSSVSSLASSFFGNLYQICAR